MLCHSLRVETACLLLDGTEGSGDRDGGIAAFGHVSLGLVEVCHEGDAVAVLERDLLVIDCAARGKGFVPFLRERQFACHHHCFLPVQSRFIIAARRAVGRTIPCE